MADIDFNLTGADEVLQRLQSLAVRTQKRSVKRAARKAMAIVRKAARDNAKRIDDPVSADKIWKNIVLQESGKAGKRVGGVVMKVGVKGGASFNRNSGSRAKLSGGDTRHWRFIELGSANNQAKPFMRPALRNNVQQVTQVFMTELNNEIAAALAGP